jgi:protein phosphatase
MSARTRKQHAALSAIGRVRSHNEDAVLASPPLFAVADGLGGHEAGEVASAIAIETLRDHAPRRADAAALGRAVKAANREVIRAAKEGIGREGMGTTITAAIVEGTRIVVAQVGDSRAYLLHGTTLSRVTQDHSMVADMIRGGQLTEAEARVHPHRSVITRALGTDPNMETDTFEVEGAPGDRLLLCSDGLTSMLTDERIAELLGGYREPMTAADALVDAANEASGQDNISVVVVDLEGGTGATRGPRESERSVRGLVAVVGWIVVAALILAGIGYGAYSYAESRAYLVEEQGFVTVYRGVPGALGPITLSWLVERTSVRVEDLQTGEKLRLADGWEFDSVEAALLTAGSWAAETQAPVPETTSTPSP